jgi:hypothetical protein
MGGGGGLVGDSSAGGLGGEEGGEGAGFRVFVGNLSWTTQSQVSDDRILELSSAHSIAKESVPAIMWMEIVVIFSVCLILR